MSDQLVNNIRRENYPLQIYTAMKNNPAVIEVTTRLISFVQDVYRSIEPGHFNGKISSDIKDMRESVLILSKHKFWDET